MVSYSPHELYRVWPEQTQSRGQASGRTPIGSRLVWTQLLCPFDFNCFTPVRPLNSGAITRLHLVVRYHTLRSAVQSVVIPAFGNQSVVIASKGYASINRLISLCLLRSALGLSAFPFTSRKQSFGRSLYPALLCSCFQRTHSHPVNSRLVALLYPALLCLCLVRCTLLCSIPLCYAPLWSILLCSGTFSVPIVVWPLCSALPRSGTFSVPIHIPQTVYHSLVKIFIYLFFFQIINNRRFSIFQLEKKSLRD